MIVNAEAFVSVPTGYCILSSDDATPVELSEGIARLRE